MAEPSAGLEISHPHLHGLLADGYWIDGVFTRFTEVDLKAIEQAFTELVLAQLHKRELITDDDVVQILSQDHTAFGVPVRRRLAEGGWLGDPFHDKESEQFVARYIERAPLSLENSQYKTTSSPTQPKTGPRMSSIL